MVKKGKRRKRGRIGKKVSLEKGLLKGKMPCFQFNPFFSDSQLFSQLAQLVLPCDRFVPPDPCILNATDYQRTFGLSFIKAELKRGEEGKRVVESNCYYK